MKTIGDNIDLSGKESRIIKRDKEISNALFMAIKDSVKLSEINKVLSIYYNNKNKQEFISSIEMRRVFKGDNVSLRVVPKDSIDMSKAIIINSLEELKTLKDKMKQDKENLNNLYKKKDSI